MPTSSLCLPTTRPIRGTIADISMSGRGSEALTITGRLGAVVQRVSGRCHARRLSRGWALRPHAHRGRPGADQPKAEQILSTIGGLASTSSTSRAAGGPYDVAGIVRARRCASAAAGLSPWWRSWRRPSCGAVRNGDGADVLTTVSSADVDFPASLGADEVIDHQRDVDLVAGGPQARSWAVRVR